MGKSEQRVSRREDFVDVLYEAADKLLVRGVSAKSLSELLAKARALGISHEGRRISIRNNGSVYYIERRGSSLAIGCDGSYKPYRDSALRIGCETIASSIYG